MQRAEESNEIGARLKSPPSWIWSWFPPKS